MKVILIQDVKNQGKKDDIINVSTGYANNYLIKNKLAVLYTEGSKKILDNEKKAKRQQEDELVNSYELIKNKLNNTNIEFKVKVGKEDRVFGSISTKQISDKLAQKGFDIDKKKIFIDGSIDALGNHIVKIKLHKKVEFFVNIVLSK